MKTEQQILAELPPVSRKLDAKVQEILFGSKIEFGSRGPEIIGIASDHVWQSRIPVPAWSRTADLAHYILGDLVARNYKCCAVITPEKQYRVFAGKALTSADIDKPADMTTVFQGTHKFFSLAVCALIINMREELSNAKS